MQQTDPKLSSSKNMIYSQSYVYWWTVDWLILSWPCCAWLQVVDWVHVFSMNSFSLVQLSSFFFFPHNDNGKSIRRQAHFKPLIVSHLLIILFANITWICQPSKPREVYTTFSGSEGKIMAKVMDMWRG